jgi:PD-(D/E)XK nuclease superfamily
MRRLAQGQLTLLTTCPRKFQHTMLDQISTPIAPEQQSRMEWGDRFHLLMQQRELGLSVNVPEAWSELQQSVDGLVAAAPELFEPALLRQSEHRRVLELEGWAIATVYDLLILNPAQAQIIDWKTYPQPPDSRRLSQNWQTRLYPFVLAETTDYEPEQISMTYCFVQPNAIPQKWELQYSAALHDQTQQELTQILHQLEKWIQDYEAGISLPQVDERYCGSCPFAVRCQRIPQQEALLAIADIAEVTL